MKTCKKNDSIVIEIDRMDMLNCRHDISNIRTFKLDDDYAMMIVVQRFPVDAVQKILSSSEKLLD